MKRIAIHTLGCKVNQVETEQIIEDFIERGYQVVDFGDPADVCIVNTCTVTHISDRKSRALLRRAIRANPQALVVATGCVAQVNAGQLAKIEGIGLVVGNGEKERLAEIVDDFYRKGSTRPKIQLEPIGSGTRLRPIIYTQPHQRTRAFVKIQDGCQSFCSYCIVPYARGPVRSKAPADVLAEIQQLRHLGYREIVLTGIHTGMYGQDLAGWDLTRLLQTILAEKYGEYRIRLSSIEPLEWSDRLLSYIAGERSICRHFHIPLQSGSDRILVSMRRRYKREYYQQLVQKIADRIPQAAFTADVMVGYPTETAADFQDTYELIRDLPLYDLHVFKYSPRAGTPAAQLSPQVEAEEKQIRSAALLELGYSKREHFLQSFVGKELEVLVEREWATDIFSGISDNYLEVHFPSCQDRQGELVRVRLEEACSSYGVAKIIE